MSQTAQASRTATAAKPAFTSFMPVNGYAPDSFNPNQQLGTTVEIDGTGLGTITNVTFNGTPASPIDHLSDTRLTVTVPSGATSGPISISDGTTTLQGSRDFTVNPPVPVIDGFQPKSGPVGTSVTISGHHLKDVTVVTFNKVPAQSITAGANQRVVAVVPPGATNGFINVKAPEGSATSATKFKVTP
jgi:hypothetical protein